MPTPRSAQPSILKPGIIALICLLSGLAGPARLFAQAKTDAVTLSISQVRTAARAALDSGKPELAYKLARSLLAADPRDPLAYYLIARALQKMDDPRLGRRAAAYAFRYADHDRDRYAAAQMAARLSYDAGQYTRAQYWLRRSLDVAPDPRLRQLAIRDFKRIAAENPWDVRLRFSAAPSSNVNSGAATDRLTVDGDPWFNWPISTDGQALSGVVVAANLDASYRLRATRQSQTRITAKMSARQVVLSSAARATVPPGVGNSDFSSQTLELGLSHSFRLGQSASRADGDGYGKLSFAFGQTWYAQTPFIRYLRLGGERGFKLKKGRFLRFGATLEQRDYGDRFPATAFDLRADYSTPLQGGAKLAAGLVLGHTASGGNNRSHDRATVYVNYQPARQIGPAKVSLTLGAGYSDYPVYRLFVPVVGGRQDVSAFGALTLQFNEIEFAGFAPALTLRARRTNSNISRFDTDELTLSIGIKSNF